MKRITFTENPVIDFGIIYGPIHDGFEINKA
jgi:hypothetical protein